MLKKFPLFYVSGAVVLFLYFTQEAHQGQARSQDFVQEGANLARAQGTPTKNRKLLGFGPLFFGSGPIYFFLL